MTRRKSDGDIPNIKETYIYPLFMYKQNKTETNKNTTKTETEKTTETKVETNKIETTTEKKTETNKIETTTNRIDVNETQQEIDKNRMIETKTETTNKTETSTETKQFNKRNHLDCPYNVCLGYFVNGKCPHKWKCYLLHPDEAEIPSVIQKERERVQKEKEKTKGVKLSLAPHTLFLRIGCATRNSTTR